MARPGLEELTGLLGPHLLRQGLDEGLLRRRHRGVVGVPHGQHHSTLAADRRSPEPRVRPVHLLGRGAESLLVRRNTEPLTHLGSIARHAHVRRGARVRPVAVLDVELAVIVLVVLDVLIDDVGPMLDRSGRSSPRDVVIHVLPAEAAVANDVEVQVVTGHGNVGSPLPDIALLFPHRDVLLEGLLELVSMAGFRNDDPGVRDVVWRSLLCQQCRSTDEE